MRGTVGETLERLILLQVGAAAATRDRVQEIVDRLIEQGRLEREEGRTVVNDVLDRARERSAGTRALIDTSLQQGLRGAGVPTREDFDDLVFRIEQLEHRVRMVEERPPAPPPAAGDAPAEGTGTVTGGVQTAGPEAARQDPETPPGL